MSESCVARHETNAGSGDQNPSSGEFRLGDQARLPARRGPIRARSHSFRSSLLRDGLPTIVECATYARSTTFDNRKHKWSGWGTGPGRARNIPLSGPATGYAGRTRLQGGSGWERARRAARPPGPLPFLPVARRRSEHRPPRERNIVRKDSEIFLENRPNSALLTKDSLIFRVIRSDRRQSAEPTPTDAPRLGPWSITAFPSRA